MDLLELIKSYLVAVATVSIADAINLGRHKVYQDYEDRIGAFQFSAILDDRTCKFCDQPNSQSIGLGLDGLNFSPDDPLLDLIRPPLHQHCRCMLVGILREELAIQDVPITTLTHDFVQRHVVGKYWLVS